MVFQKVDLGGSNLTWPTLLLVYQSSPDFFSTNAGGIAVEHQFTDVGYLHPFRRYSRSKFEVDQSCP